MLRQAHRPYSKGRGQAVETTICGASAFRFWRTPPIVLQLSAYPDDDSTLSKLVGQETLGQLRLELAETSPISASCSHGPSWRTAGTDARRIRDALPMFMPWAQAPVDVLVREHRLCHASSLVHPCLWSADLPFGSAIQLADEINVTSAAFTMLQLASQVNLVNTMLMASELCGSFSVYKPPRCIAKTLQDLIDQNRLPVIDGWRPSLSNGKLTSLWTRPPLIQPSDLLEIATISDSRRGCRRLQKAAALIKANAASPFEVQAALLMGLPRAQGGEGYAGLRLNEEVRLSAEARLLAGRDRCYCDLYWDNGLDIECQSAQHHDNAESYISDADRTAALQLMGINVLPVTYGQLNDPRRFEALSHVVCRAHGMRWRPKTQKELEASSTLRSRVLIDWALLPDLAFRHGD